jgi:RNA polymerase sigma-70 factor (ECF subfamily)
MAAFHSQMTASAHNSSLALQEDRAWLLGIARKLVNDKDDADDLVQETLVRAWKSEPQPGAHRSWLAAILRNVWRMRIRGTLRRSQREAAFADGAEDQPDSESALRRLRAFEELARAIRELPEDQREALLLRYVEDLSSTQIAEELEIPAGTVRWRLSQARGSLRNSLGEYNYSFAALVAAMHPSAKLTSALAASKTATVGKGVLMGTTGKLAAAAVACAALGGGYALWRQDPQTPAPQAPSMAPVAKAVESETKESPKEAQKAEQPSKGSTERINKEEYKRLHKAMVAALDARENRRQGSDAREKSIPTSSEKAPKLPTDPKHDLEVILDGISEIKPLIKECYELALHEDPDLEGTLVIEVDVITDPDMGTLIEDSRLREDNELSHPTFDQCIRETMYSLKLEALDNPEGRMTFTMPLTMKALGR